MFEEQENNVVLNENSVERKICINRESKSDELKFSYTVVTIQHVAPLRRRSGRKSSQVRKIFFCM